MEDDNPYRSPQADGESFQHWDAADVAAWLLVFAVAAFANPLLLWPILRSKSPALIKALCCTTSLMWCVAVGRLLNRWWQMLFP